jgi:hypothetical protein
VSITLVGVQTASATSLTPPAHLPGDLILICAERNSSATAPSLPSGYNAILTQAQGANVSMRVGYKIATATNDASGTWTNATEMTCHVYRPSAGNTLRMGQHASSSSTTTTVTYPALTLADPNSGNSWIVGFAGANNITQTLNTAPTGMTNQSSLVGAAGQVAGQDTNGGVSSWSVQTVSAGAGDSVSCTIELVLAPTSSGIFGTNVYQHIGGGGNANAGSNPGSTYTLPLNQKSGAGNTLRLYVTYDAGATLTSVVGAVNGSFGARVASALGGAGNLDTACYLLQNIAAGQETLTLSFFSPIAATALVNGTNYTITTIGTTDFTLVGAASNTVGLVFSATGAGTGSGTATQAITVFQYVLTEYYGVATSGGIQGSTSRAFSTTQNANSFTPTNNNSTGGNVVDAYFVKSLLTPTVATSAIFPGAGFTLLNADIAWNASTNSIPKLCEAFVQATSAAVTPAFVSVADTADQWNSLSIALAISAGAGTAPTPANNALQINKVDHFTTHSFPASGNYAVQAPAVGNLRAICCTDGGLNALTITDSEGNIWNSDGGVGTGIFYLGSTSANPNLLIFITGGGSDVSVSWRYIDYSGAAASPFIGAWASAGQNLNGLSSFSLSPSPAPTSAPGQLLSNVGLGQGPGLAITAPSNGVWGLVTYVGEVDSDEIENADIMAHIPYSVTGAITVTYTITNQASNNSSGGTVAFLAAPPAPSVQSVPMMGGMCL